MFHRSGDDYMSNFIRIYQKYMDMYERLANNPETSKFVEGIVPPPDIRDLKKPNPAQQAERILHAAEDGEHEVLAQGLDILAEYSAQRFPLEDK